LLGDEKKALSAALIEMHFTKGEVILQQGEAGNTFYILYDGEVSVSKDNVEQTKLSASPSRQTAQFFGERALMNAEPRAATVSVTSTTAKALALDRDSFNLLLGPLEDIIKRAGNKQSRPSLTKAQGTQNPQDAKRDKILRKDLQKVGLLGCGGFGAVELYEHKKTGDTYAMKGLSKGYIVKTGMQDSVMNEKNILMMTNSSFIIRLYECYNGSQTLYFLMEPALGGELYATYNRKGFHGSEKHAKFYCAGVVFSFEHMHERRIIYRDLKPENLLLNEKGEIKLTDMGLAKFVIGKTYTTCGTPDYFAPELIASTGHTNAVDWWTLGILMFELMSGHPPFESAYPMQIYSKVMKGISKVPFPPKCQGPVGDLIKALLKKEPSERLPMQSGGNKKLRDHKWYAGFDWEAMNNLKLDPPYKPVVKSKKDIANFSARKEDMPRQIEYKDDGTGWDKEFAT
jgi:cGMP-dependent protein kinase